MATIKLYSASSNTSTKWELLPNKLFKIDDIATYLSSWPIGSIKTINNVQYIKNGLEISINLDLSQSYAQPNSVVDYKYASIKNSGTDDEICYYFIKKINWRSKSCVNLELVMDVLNTFEEGKDYKFKESTKITREHKDRFTLKNYEITLSIESIISLGGTLDNGDSVYIKYTEGLEQIIACGGVLTDYDPFNAEDRHITFSLENTYDIQEAITLIRNNLNSIIVCLQSDEDESITIKLTSADYDCSLYRNIDRTPENIVPLLVCDNTADETIQHHKSALRGDWYLLYRNQNDPTDSLVNPVECYLIPSKKIKTAYGYVENGRIIPSFIEEGKYYFFEVENGRTFTLSNGITYSEQVGKTCMLVTKAGGKLTATCYGSNSGAVFIYGMYNNLDYITANTLPSYYQIVNTLPSPLVPSFFEDYLTFPETFNNSGTENELDPITYLDRTDAKNIKLIKLPYCPYDFTISGTALQVSTDWDYVSLTQSGGGIINFLKLISLDTKLEGTIEETTYNPLDYLYFNKLSNLSISASQLRNQANYESKLYHSEFFTPTFYYDSFAFKFELEKCDLFDIFANYTKTSVANEIKFDMTRTINSKFMFTFSNYEVLNNEQNYSKYLPIARNNEEVLYNVPYINYIRTGYQYDVKNKNISNISNAVGVGLSAGSLAVSLALPSAPLKVAGVVASLVSMAMSVKSAVVSAIESDNSLKQKIAQYQNQSSNVAGSDDVDLMSIYAENRLKYLEYKPRQELQDLIFDLFFYAGYRSERMGIPTHNNRANFDYLECEANFECLAGGIPQECAEELIKCFQNGVTYIHKNTHRSGTARWDMEQKYENWETMFFD